MRRLLAGVALLVAAVGAAGADAATRSLVVCCSHDADACEPAARTFAARNRRRAAMNEFALIDRHFRRASRDPAVRLSVGDDAAIVVPRAGCELALSVDMLVEGRHFLPDVDPATLGHKTLAVNLSDMAAMGATPRWALLAGALPDDDEPWLAAFSAGLFALAARYSVTLVGGDTTRGPRNLCLTIVGELPAGTAITRAGAAPGDDIQVSGRLGDAALALAALQRRTELNRTRWRRCAAASTRRNRASRSATGSAASRPPPSTCPTASPAISRTSSLRPASARTSNSRASRTRPRSRESSRATNANSRSRACSPGGDDYELCFTAPASARARLAAIAVELSLPVTRIGSISAAPGLRVRDADGRVLAALPQAFDHFR